MISNGGRSSCAAAATRVSPGVGRSALPGSCSSRTEEGIATRLRDAGIPREESVLAFYAPQKRQYTEFAVS
jgi:hypothetical protein